MRKQKKRRIIGTIKVAPCSAQKIRRDYEQAMERLVPEPMNGHNLTQVQHERRKMIARMALYDYYLAQIERVQEDEHL